MQQQINLYQPTRTENNQLFSAATAASALSVVTVLLLLIYGYGVHAVNRLAREVDAAHQQQQRETALLTAGVASTPHAVEVTVLQAQLKTLNKTLADHRRALQLLRVGGAGGEGGFSARLTALANQHVDGVWLDHVVLSSSVGVETLNGGAVSAELIPRYLHSLTAEPALIGTRFDEFSINGKHAALPEITDSTTAKTASETNTTIHFHAANTSGKTMTSTATATADDKAPPPPAAGSS